MHHRSEKAEQRSQWRSRDEGESTRAEERRGEGSSTETDKDAPWSRGSRDQQEKLRSQEDPKRVTEACARVQVILMILLWR